MTETLEFDDTGLDRWTDDERFDVTQDRLAEYAAATNDPIEAHRRGDVAPPVFAIVPVFEALLTPAVDVMPVEAIPRIVHGEQDFHFHRPIRRGDKLVSRGKMIGYQGLEKGTRAAILLECRTEDGELVNEQYVTTFVRGMSVGKTIGELSPDHKFDDKLREQAPVAKVVQHIDTRPDLPLLARGRRPDADPPRRGGGQGCRSARHHRARAVHHGVHVVGGADRARRTRMSTGSSASRSGSPSRCCPVTTWKPGSGPSAAPTERQATHSRPRAVTTSSSPTAWR